MASRRRNASERHSAEADQVELIALASGDAAIEVGVDDGQLSGVLDDSAAEAMPHEDAELHRDDLAHDDLVGPIHEELCRRASLLECAYPFQLEPANLVYNHERHSVMYEFLLAASISARGQLLHEATRLFERVATQVIESYFGKNARSMHFGWPRDAKTSFRDAVKEIHARTHEWVWGPEAGLNPAHANDERCDFVVWLESADRRVGQLFVVGQCACGNNWQDKWGELNVERFRRWFNPLSWVQPVRSLATPRHVADDLLKEASREAGLIFDRSRLVLAALDQDILDSETVAAMKSLTKRLSRE